MTQGVLCPQGEAGGGSVSQIKPLTCGLTLTLKLWNTKSDEEKFPSCVQIPKKEICIIVNFIS